MKWAMEFNKQEKKNRLSPRKLEYGMINLSVSENGYGNLAMPYIYIYIRIYITIGVIIQYRPL